MATPAHPGGTFAAHQADDVRNVEVVGSSPITSTSISAGHVAAVKRERILE